MDEIERASWQLVQAYLHAATPAQWHLYAARSNYDDNRAGLIRVHEDVCMEAIPTSDR